MTNINTPPPYTGPTPTQQDVPELSMPPIQEAPSRAEQAIEQMKRIAHHAGNLYLRGRIQVSEIGEGIAKIRSRRSAKVMEKMDHKQQLYKHLGIQADSIGEAVPEDTGVVHRDPTSQPPRIRSRAERRMDERITKKQDEAEKSANARRADITDYRGKNYGHVTKRTRNKINRRIEKSGKRRGLTTSEIRLEQIKSRTNFVTPEEYDALSPEDQKNVSTFDTETGKMGKVKADLDSSRPETKQQKRNRLKAEKDYKSLKRATTQPILSRWRVGSPKQLEKAVAGRKPGLANITSRRGRAIGSIKMNHSRVVRAQAKQETLRVELEARREAAEEADI